MEDLYIPAAEGTPEVRFSAKTGVLHFSGRANSNNIKLFYKRPDDWLNEYLHHPCEVTTVEVKVEYINSVFNKLLLKFLEKSKTVLNKDKKLVVKWFLYPDDEDGEEECDLYSRLINFPFEKILRS